jgi:hypothetical protein
MRRGREQAELVKACAAAHGITPRGVRKWRDANDDRWVRFLAARAAAGSLPVGSAATVEPEEARQWTDTELALDFQIRKLKEATADLRERAELARKANDLDAEMALRRMTLQHTEALRRLEKDAPGILRESGDVIPRRQAEQALVGYASSIKASLQMLPNRIFSLFPELAAEVKDAVIREVQEIQRAAASLKLTDGESA